MSWTTDPTTPIPCITDPASPTVLDPPPCGLCPNKATITCRTCDNMQYCSTKCQEEDAPVHNTICTSFQYFRERPSPHHYRAILFHAIELRPQFIWLCMKGTRGFHDVYDDDWSRYCTGRRSSNFTITNHQDFSPPRQYNHRILVEYDEHTFGGGVPINRCLTMLCGTQVERFRGNYIARGCKYTGDTKPDERDPCDVLIPYGCRIALDLDTTCLNPLLAWFNHYAEFEEKYCSFQ